MVEFAIVSSVFFLILCGLLVFSLCIFSYQQVARLARDASRWASVHSADYAQATSSNAAEGVVYTNAIQPYAAGLNASSLTYSVSWPNGYSPYHTTNGQNIANTVTVTISYSCLQMWPLTSALTVTSTSTSVMYN